MQVEKRANKIKKGLFILVRKYEFIREMGYQRIDRGVGPVLVVRDSEFTLENHLFRSQRS